MSRNAGIINKVMNTRRSMSSNNDNSSKYETSEKQSNVKEIRTSKCECDLYIVGFAASFRFLCPT